MENTARPACPRLLIRNLNAPQKCLVFVILAAVGFGYIGALVHLFSSSAGADGKQTISVEQFANVYQAKGFQGLFAEIQNSLGLQDVIKTYHGSGPGITRMEAALHGVMKPILLKENNGDEATVAAVTQPLIEWSHLAPDLRKKAYEEGVPLDDDGNPDFKMFVELFGDGPANPQLKKKDVELDRLSARWWRTPASVATLRRGK